MTATTNMLNQELALRRQMKRKKRLFGSLLKQPQRMATERDDSLSLAQRAAPIVFGEPEMMVDPDFWTGVGKEATFGLVGLPGDIGYLAGGVAAPVLNALSNNWSEGAPLTKGLFENVGDPEDYAFTSDALAAAAGMPYSNTPNEIRGRVLGGLIDVGTYAGLARHADTLIDNALAPRTLSRGPLGGQRGAWTPLAGGDELPMDEASRMQRAREMGFDVDRPLYRGSRSDELTQARFYADDPEYAGMYAMLKSRFPDEDAPNIAKVFAKREARMDDIPGGATGFREWHEASRWGPAPHDLIGDTGEVSFYYADRFKDYVESITGKTPAAIAIDEANGRVAIKALQDGAIRSVNAKFDPAKRNSPNILAGLAPLGIGGPLAAGLYQPESIGLLNGRN